ncbi:MAG: cupin domain-containing protein, partial [Chloroflexi bacterium]|nr:cupin domain-containing protein [Chloroflexota bacterium]
AIPDGIHLRVELQVRQVEAAERDEVPEPGAVSHPETGGHNHSWDHTVFILEGTGTIVVSGTEYTVTAGDAVRVPPGEHHQWKNETDAPMLRVTFNDIVSEGHG